MENLLDNIRALENVSAALEPSLDERNDYANELQEFTNGFIETVESKKAYNTGDADTQKLSIHPEKKTLTQLLEIYNDEVIG